MRLSLFGAANTTFTPTSLPYVLQAMRLLIHMWNNCNISSFFIIYGWRTSVLIFLCHANRFSQTDTTIRRISRLFDHFAAGNYCSSYVRKFFSNAVRNHDITIPRLTIFECADAKLNTDFAERGLYCPQTCSAVKLKSMYQETANYQSKASRK